MALPLNDDKAQAAGRNTRQATVDDIVVGLAVPYPGEGGVAPEMFTVAACAPSIAGKKPAPVAPNAMAATQMPLRISQNAPEIIRGHGIFLRFFVSKSRKGG